MRIVRIHVDLNPISHQHANVVQTHFAGDIGKNNRFALVQCYTKHRSFERLNHRSFFKRLFFFRYHECVNPSTIYLYDEMSMVIRSGLEGTRFKKAGENMRVADSTEPKFFRNASTSAADRRFASVPSTSSFTIRSA